MLAFPGVSRIFPADAALGLSVRIIGEKNTAVNRIGNYPLTVGNGFKQYVDVRLMGERTHYLSAPKDINMRIPDRLLSSVGFISYDQPTIQYGGTMFIVGVKGGYDGNAYLHLVTAKHVAEHFEASPFVIGMNGKDGKKILLKSGDEFRWFYHPTEPDSVDVAVLPFQSQILTEYELTWIPETAFLDDDSIKKHGIGIGDEIATIGLFTRYSGGAGRHFPIVRTGNIAMMPTEKVPVAQFGEVDAVLAEVRSIGGLSGSPVFVRNTVNMPAQTAKGEPVHITGLGPVMAFLGLMHGHWDLPVDFNATQQMEAVNMGISIIVPAKKILETIYHPELVAMRKHFDDEARKENQPVMDSAFAKPSKETFTKNEFETALKKVSRKTTAKK